MTEVIVDGMFSPIMVKAGNYTMQRVPNARVKLAAVFELNNGARVFLLERLHESQTFYVQVKEHNPSTHPGWALNIFLSVPDNVIEWALNASINDTATFSRRKLTSLDPAQFANYRLDVNATGSY